MKLEEAIRILIWSQSQMRLGNLPDYSQNVYQSIETILQEIEHLQKENEELKNERNCYRAQVNSAFDNGFIHKDKIRDCLDDIEDYFERVSVPYEDIEFIKEKRKDLLKEE